MTTVKFTNPDLGEFTGLIIHGEPWFLAGQVCRALGIKNASQAVAQVEQRFKIAEQKGIFSKYTLLQTAGGRQKVQIALQRYL